jgi:hypothetical protein
MKALRYLFLSLDCFNRRPDNSQFDEEDRRPVDSCRHYVTKEDLKQALINHAVDEALARSIWKTISQDKRDRQLESLRLWTTETLSEGIPTMYSHDTFIKNVSRSWLIERVPRDDQDDIIVRELGKRGREPEANCVRHSCHESAVEKIFHEIWPRKEGSKDWQDDWSSFPLQT